jgi:hypothetical protein
LDVVPAIPIFDKVSVQESPMNRWYGTIVLVALAALACGLAACAPPGPQIQTSYHGPGTYSVGVYDDPAMNRDPGGF